MLILTIIFFIFGSHSWCWWFIFLNVDWPGSWFCILLLLFVVICFLYLILRLCYHLLISISDLFFIVLYKVNFDSRLTVKTFVTLYSVVFFVIIDITIPLADYVDCLLDAINLLFEVGMLMFIKDFAHVSFIGHCYLFICFGNSFINNLKHLKLRDEITLRKFLRYLVGANSCNISLLLILFISIHVRHIRHELRQMLIENSNSWGGLFNNFT